MTYAELNRYVINHHVRPPGLSLAQLMAHHDIKSWQAHDAKEPLELAYEMACLYELGYGISKKEALDTLEYFLTAVYWHDLSEMALDSGDHERAKLCWQYVHPNLVQHYTSLAKKMGKPNYQKIGSLVADHDVQRWGVHHHRDLKAYCEHEANMNVLLCGMSFEEGLALAKLRGKAVWLHNKTDVLENVHRLNEVQKYWHQAEEVLVAHYELFLTVMAKQLNVNSQGVG